MQGRATIAFGGHEIPSAWRVGDFELEIAELTDGRLDEAAGVLRGVAGKAWLRLPCARPPIHTVGVLEHPDVSRLTHAVEVVAEVLHPQTEISLAEAQQLRPDVGARRHHRPGRWPSTAPTSRRSWTSVAACATGSTRTRAPPGSPSSSAT